MGKRDGPTGHNKRFLDLHVEKPIRKHNRNFLGSYRKHQDIVYSMFFKITMNYSVSVRFHTCLSCFLTRYPCHRARFIYPTRSYGVDGRSSQLTHVRDSGRIQKLLYIAEKLYKDDARMIKVRTLKA